MPSSSTLQHRPRLRRLVALATALAITTCLILAGGSVGSANASTPKRLTATPTPTIHNTAIVGQTMAGSAGKWAPTSVKLSYQWLRSGKPISGATKNSYKLASVDSGTMISLQVTGSSPGYSSVAKTSAAKTVLRVLQATPTPSLSGTIAVGGTLTAKAGTWAPAPVTLKYQWYRGSSAITGATAATYRLATADAGASILVRVTGSKAGYATVAKYSAKVAVPRLLVSAMPTILGTPTLGATLRILPGAWSPAPTSFRYQWYRDGSAIAGASAQTHTIVAADVNHRLTVSVSGARSGYTTVTRIGGSALVFGAFTTSPVPSIVGLPRVGHSLTAITGTWSPSATLTFQWLRGGKAIPGAAGSTYALTAADLGSTITVQITGARVGYASLVRTSAATAKVASAVVKHVSGEITQNTTWKTAEADVYVLDNDVSVARGATLTVSAGVIVKATTEGMLTVGGTVEVVGTALQPVVFTRIQDDSAGGDSNGDGNATSPVTSSGTWAFALGEGAGLSLTHAVVRHVGHLFYWGADAGTYPNHRIIRIEDSTLNTLVSLTGMDRPVLQRTVIRSSTPNGGDFGLSLNSLDDVTGVALSGPDRITMTGTAAERSISFAGSTVPSGSAYSLTAESGVSAFLDTLIVSGSVDIRPGVVYKGSIDSAVGGRIDVAGTTANPVVFSTALDDTAGGDTNGDGTTTAPLEQYWTYAFKTADHTDITLSHVTVRDDYYLFYARRQAERTPVGVTTTIRDSNLDTFVRLLDPNRPVLERTTIHSHAGDGTYGGLALDVTDMSGIALNGPDRITLTGTPAQRVVDGSEVVAGTVVTLTNESGVSAFDGGFLIYGVLNIAPGVVVKGGSIQFWDGGAIHANGTSDSPVVFTSREDDSAAGDTNGDGAASVTSPDNWSTLFYPVTGTDIDLSHVEVRNLGYMFHQLRQFERIPDHTTVKIVDSTIDAYVGIVGVDRPVIARTTIRSRLFNTGQDGLSLTYVDDITGVALSGSDRITLTGTAGQRAIHYAYATVPGGTTYSMTTESGVSSFTSGLYVDGTLDVAPGVVFKGRVTVDNGASIHVAGTDDRPVIFTDYYDSSAGGDTNNGGANSKPTTINDGPWLSIGTGAGSTIDHAVFNYVDVGIHVGEFASVAITNSKFVNTRMAIDVASAGSADDQSKYFYGQLPCSPPFDSLVTVSNTWFGATGKPGVEFDSAFLEHKLVDGIGQSDVLSFFNDQMTSQLDLRVETDSNATPWAMYECSIPASPPIPIRIPVTPVSVGAPPPTEWLPDIAQDTPATQ